MKDQELNTEHSIAVSKRNLKASIIDAFFPNEMHNQNIMSELTSGMPFSVSAGITANVLRLAVSGGLRSTKL